MKIFIFAIAALGLASLPAVRSAWADGDPKATIEEFDNVLMDVMKNATKLGYNGRYQKLAPTIEKIYDLPLMARISVGPQWSALTPEQQSKIIDAFKSLSVATYASRFDGWDGEQFQITGETPTTGGDDVVDTKLMRPKDDAVDLNYRLRKNGDSWRIIDVFLSGTISQLANYRSEFSATLRGKGVDALIALINEKVAALAPKG